MPDRRVLVVGTTADYVEHIHQIYPGQALFVTAEEERRRSQREPPDNESEILTDLSSPHRVLAAIDKQCSRFGMVVDGVACFDCESLALAAFLGRKLHLEFVTPEAVILSRDKFASKQVWKQHGITCPATDIVRSHRDALNFFDRLQAPIVLKPLTGSGSELTFVCRDRYEVTDAFETLEIGLAQRSKSRMYSAVELQGRVIDPTKVFGVEQFIEGREYSCDFIIESNRVTIIRTAKKIPAKNEAFGTTLAYLVPGRLPGGVDQAVFRSQLRAAASALGLNRALCMVDFVIHRDRPVFLEMTPRPGGDCLPALLRHSAGFDMLGLELDFARGKPIVLPEVPGWQPMAGLRLFVRQSGQVTALDAKKILQDPRVRECRLIRRVGHEIILPPEDYDSRLLGYVIFAPTDDKAVEHECVELRNKLTLTVERITDEQGVRGLLSDRRTAGTAYPAA
jgi:biotin carboxylase